VDHRLENTDLNVYTKYCVLNKTGTDNVSQLENRRREVEGLKNMRH